MTDSFNFSQTTFLGITGLSPAVITETLWVLAHEEEPCIPDRVVVLTTQTGREQLLPWFEPEGVWEQFRNDLAASTGLDLDGKLKFGPSSQAIRVVPHANFQGDLVDIRTPEDNKAVAGFFLEVVRSFTEGQNSRLLVSIAGGRKTMSALLYAVMSMLGRVQDRVLHVLVDEPWERMRGFTHPGCSGNFLHPESAKRLDSSTAGLHMAEVPFIPLRYLFEKELASTPHDFTSLMRRISSLAAGHAPQLHLRFEPAVKGVEINGTYLNLSPNEYAIWLAFAAHAKEGKAALESLVDITPWFVEVLDRFLQADDFSHWTHPVRELEDPDLAESGRKWLSSIRNKLRNLGFTGQDIERLVPRSGRFSIQIPTDNLEILED